MTETTVDPTADGATSEWTSTEGTHYGAVADAAVRNPDTPNLTKSIAGDHNDIDIITCTVANSGNVSDVELQLYGDDSQGQCTVDISKDGTNWEGGKTTDFSSPHSWLGSTMKWSTLGWTPAEDLTLYIKFIFGPGTIVTLYGCYAIVTHEGGNGNGGGGSKIITGNILRG